MNQIELFLKRIVTADKKWIQYNNSVNKRQWLDKDEVPQTIVKPENFGNLEM